MTNWCLLLARGIFPAGTYFILWIACSLEFLCTVFSCLTHDPYFKIYLLSIQFGLKYNFSDWQFKKGEAPIFFKLGKQNNLLAVQKHWWHYLVTQKYVVYCLLKCESEHSWQVNEEGKIKIWAQTKAALIIQVTKICIQKKTVKVIERYICKYRTFRQ